PYPHSTTPLPYTTLCRSNPPKHVLADFVRDVSAHNDIRHRKAPTGFEHPERFPQDPVLVSGKIDHAVRNDDVHGIIRERNAFNLPFEELDILDSRFSLILSRKSKHVVCHVQPVDFPRLA